MTVEIVRYDDRYRREVAGLLTRLWSKDTETNERYLQWCYLSNPVMTEPVLHLAVDAGEVVAVRGARGVAWDIGPGASAERCIVPCMGDTVISDSHGNQGLLSRLTDSLQEDMAGRGIPYSFNLSPGKVTLLSSLRAGWRSIGRWPTVAWQGNAGDPTTRAVAFARLDRHLGGRDPRNDAILVSDQPKPEPMARITAAANRGRIRPSIDARYLAWRFQNPLNEYRFLYHEDKAVDGYLVLRVSPRRPQRAYVLDLQANAPEAMAALIRAAVRLGGFDEIRMWWLRLPLKTMRVLVELGFGEARPNAGISRYLPTFLVRPTRVDVSRSTWSINGVPLLDVGNWEIKLLVADLT